jgi:hypothetical protein
MPYRDVSLPWSIQLPAPIPEVVTVAANNSYLYGSDSPSTTIACNVAGVGPPIMQTTTGPYASVTCEANSLGAP